MHKLYNLKEFLKLINAFLPRASCLRTTEVKKFSLSFMSWRSENTLLYTIIILEWSEPVQSG